MSRYENKDPRRTPPPGGKAHPTITRGQGAPLILERDSGKDCPTCQQGRLYVVDEHLGADVSLHCERCDHAETVRRSEVAPKGAPQTPPRLPFGMAPPDPYASKR